MNWRSIAVLGGIGAMAGCSASPTESTAGDSSPPIVLYSKDREPLEGIIIADCSGESVALSGYHSFFFKQHEDAAGGIHVAAQLRQHVDGVGLASGRRYVGSYREQLSLFVPAGSLPLPAEGWHVSEQIRLRFIGQGDTPNQLLDARRHLTITPNGEVTASFDEFQMDCSGES